MQLKPEQDEIERLIESYRKTQRNIRFTKMTNVGDIQSMRLRRIRELGSPWTPIFQPQN